MKFWKTTFLVSAGGFLEANFAQNASAWNSGVSGQVQLWLLALVVSGGGWAWAVYGDRVKETFRRRLYASLGRPAPAPETDPQALAAEIAALNRQVAALRDTAASFDAGFGDTLRRLDERLGRMEQQSAYLPATDPAPPPRRDRPQP